MFDKNILNAIKNNDLQGNTYSGNFGLEKENLRVTKNGNLAMTPHPAVFGDKLNNPYITVDFSESQVEMITPPENSINELYTLLENLHDIISLELKDEYLWPQSVPPNIPNEEDIPIAHFSDTPKGKDSEAYRKMLAETYGRNTQLLSGIHYNFSFKDEFLEELNKLIAPEKSLKEFRDYVYLKISRNYIKYHWLIIYLIGASSAVHETYFSKCLHHKCKCMNNMKKKNNYYYSHDAISFRHGRCGYRNKEDLFVSFNSIDKYIKDLEELIKAGTITGAREFYSPVRIKTKPTNNILKALKDDGIQYLEVRTIDINPYCKAGIEIKDLHFIHLFLLYCLFLDDCVLRNMDYHMAIENHDMAAMSGKADGQKLYKYEGGRILLKDWSDELFNGMEELIKILNFKTEFYLDILNFERKKLQNDKNMYSSKIVEDVLNSDLVSFHIDKAKKYLVESKKREKDLEKYKSVFGINS
jgi:glutamate--cysteine ligase